MGLQIQIVVEVVLATMLLAFLVTQLLLPAIRGTAMFPMLRREGKIHREIIDARQQAREEALQAELRAEQSKAKKGEYDG
jgi:hypothetical protein